MRVVFIFFCGLNFVIEEDDVAIGFSTTMENHVFLPLIPHGRS